MAKIDRYNGNLQAPASAALGTERTIFGEVTQSDDLTDQFTADLLRGWGIVGPSNEPTLQDFNAMGFTLGQLHAYLHQVGVAEYNAAQEYHEGSFTNSGGVLYVSLVNNNVGNTPASSPSQWEAYGQQDPLNAAIATVAAAGTINLTTGAPSTSQLAISGAGVTINGFTVAANRFFVARFAGANTLVNGGPLVTNTGANITTAAGDSCLLRATAANTVEVLCYTRAGSGTWQNLLASRAAATNYTNPYSHEIEISVVTGDVAANSAGLSVLINGNTVYNAVIGASAGAAPRIGVVITIPPFATYRVNIDGVDTLQSWWEKRP